MNETADISITSWKLGKELITDSTSKVVRYEKANFGWDFDEGTFGAIESKEEHLAVSTRVTHFADEEFQVYREWGQRGHLEYSLNNLIPNDVDDPRLVFLKSTIKMISESIHDHYLDRMDLDGMALVVINKLDDDDIQLEFCQESYRMGIRIDQNIQDSIWYLVTDGTLGNVSATGQISGDYSNGIIKWLMYFVGLAA